jgi:hypothetical protein
MPLHGNGNRLCKDDLRDFEVDVLIYGDSKLVINKITVDLARYEKAPDVFGEQLTAHDPALNKQT